MYLASTALGILVGISGAAAGGNWEKIGSGIPIASIGAVDLISDPTTPSTVGVSEMTPC